MKKIIAITAMAAAMAASAMADEPVADLNVAEVTGNAKVTWGADLDDSFSNGFRNEGEATLKVNFANKGSRSTEGDGIWGEIGVEVTQNVGFKSHTGSTDESDVGDWDGDNGGKIKVSAAKLHFGPVYVGITSGDTQVGDFKVPNAIMSADNGDNAIQIGAVAGDSHTQGIVAGYGDDNFGVDVDVRSLNSGDDYYTSNYGFAAEAKLKDSNSFVPGLFADVGFAFNDGYIGIGANGGYKLAMGEKFYLKPTVAYNIAIDTDDGSNEMGLVGGVLFGWGDTEDANAGVPYLDNDQTKKVTPGVGVAVALRGLGTDYPVLGLYPSFYSGDLIPNLKVAASADVMFGLYDGAPDPSFAIAAGAKYTLAIGDSVKISPYGGARFAVKPDVYGYRDLYVIESTDNAGVSNIEGELGDNLLNVTAGVEFGGLISNTTFDVNYKSRNLTKTSDGAKIGTINVSCKIAL